MGREIDTLLTSSKVQMSFAKVKLFDTDAQKAVLTSYLRDGKNGPIEEYISTNFIQQTVIDYMLSYPAVPDVLVIQFNIDERILWDDVVKQMYIQNMDLYQMFFADGISRANYLDLFLDRLKSFLSSGNYEKPLTEEDVIVNTLKSDADILIAMSFYGLICKAFTYKLLLRFYNQYKDKLTENNRAVLFRNWLPDNIIFDEVIDRVLAYPDTKGFLRKRMNLIDIDKQRAFLTGYFKDRTYIYQQFFDNRITDEDIEMIFLKDMHGYVSTLKGKK